MKGRGITIAPRDPGGARFHPSGMPMSHCSQPAKAKPGPMPAPPVGWIRWDVPETRAGGWAPTAAKAREAAQAERGRAVPSDRGGQARRALKRLYAQGRDDEWIADALGLSARVVQGWAIGGSPSVVLLARLEGLG